MVSYIEELVRREKAARVKQDAVALHTLDQLIDWHQLRISQLKSAVAGCQKGRVRHENAKVDKFRHAIVMHEATLVHLNRLKE